MKTAKVWLVTGASRGLGLEFVRQILEGSPSDKCVAGARNPTDTPELLRLEQEHKGRLLLTKLDITNASTVQAAVEQVADAFPDGVDVLINNAAITGDILRASEDPVENVEKVLLTNVLGTHRTTLAFLPLLRKGGAKTIINISSSAGSLKKNSATTLRFGAEEMPNVIAGRLMAYRTSKAALNMATLTLANDLEPEGFTLISLHPGWVATDMGSGSIADLGLPEGARPDLDTPTSVACMMKVIGSLTPEQTGAFLNWKGETMPW